MVPAAALLGDEWALGSARTMVAAMRVTFVSQVGESGQCVRCCCLRVSCACVCVIDVGVCVLSWAICVCCEFVNTVCTLYVYVCEGHSTYSTKKCDSQPTSAKITNPMYILYYYIIIVTIYIYIYIM